jgi:hypothetical protein
MQQHGLESSLCKLEEKRIRSFNLSVSKSLHMPVQRVCQKQSNDPLARYEYSYSRALHMPMQRVCQKQSNDTLSESIPLHHGHQANDLQTRADTEFFKCWFPNQAIHKPCP